MAGRVIGWAVAAGIGVVTTVITNRILQKSQQLSSSSPGRKPRLAGGADQRSAPRTESRGSPGAAASGGSSSAAAPSEQDVDAKWRARCEDLEAKLAKAAAGAESVAAAPREAELRKLGRDKRLQRDADAATEAAADDDDDDESSSSFLSSSDSGADDPVPEDDDDEYIEGVGNRGEAREAYRKIMSEGKNTPAQRKKRLVAALEDKQKDDAAEDELSALRRKVASLQERNATLNAKLDIHGDADPREHNRTEYTASAGAVRLLKPLHGEWVLVAGSDAHVDIVADEYDPSHKEEHSATAAGSEPRGRYKAFRVVVSDTHSQEILLNEYICLHTAFRVATPCFHALTTTHGFEYGLQFHTDADATAVYDAVTAARKYMARQSSMERIPCLVNAWQAARGAIDHSTATPAALAEQPVDPKAAVGYYAGRPEPALVDSYSADPGRAKAHPLL